MKGNEPWHSSQVAWRSVTWWRREFQRKSKETQSTCKRILGFKLVTEGKYRREGRGTCMSL